MGTLLWVCGKEGEGLEMSDGGCGGGRPAVGWGGLEREMKRVCGCRWGRLGLRLG